MMRSANQTFGVCAQQPIFRALADPTRRAIIGLLASGALPAGEVARHFDMSRPAVAKHLKILREGGIVVTVPRGRERVNRLNAMPLQAADDWLRQFEPFWKERLSKLKHAVENMEKSR